jgi:type II secretion system protein L
VADTLFIRLGEHGASWATFAPTGQITSALSRGPLADARAAADGRRVVALVPGIDVLSTQAELRRRALLECGRSCRSRRGFLADDVEGLMFAVGGRIGATAAAVAVVSKARLEGWLAELSAAGIVPQAVYSETDGVPDVPATLMLLLEGEQVYARRPGQPPFVLEGVPLRQVVNLLRAGGTEDLKHAIACRPGRTRASARRHSRACGCLRTEAKVAADGLFPHFAATRAAARDESAPRPYATKSNWLELARPWRNAAAMLGAAVLIGIVLQGAEYWSLRRADTNLGNRLATTCQQVVGTNRTSACDAEIQKRLHAGGKSLKTFLTTLEAIAAMRDPRCESMR